MASQIRLKCFGLRYAFHSSYYYQSKFEPWIIVSRHKRRPFVGKEGGFCHQQFVEIEKAIRGEVPFPWNHCFRGQSHRLELKMPSSGVGKRTISLF